MEKVFILIIAVLSAAFIAYPFFRNRSQGGFSEKESIGKGLPKERFAELNSRKESLYAALKEFDFDYSMGKLSKEDYEELKDKYKTQAIEVLKEIDEVQHKADYGDLEEEIEKEIRAIRENKSYYDEEIEEKILQARKSRIQETAKLICSKCGNEYKSDDRFCSNCGVKLNI